MFEQVANLGGIDTIVCPPLSMGVYAYPHREGARMTMEILLGWLDGEEEPGIKDFILLVNDENFVKNLKKLYTVNLKTSSPVLIVHGNIEHAVTERT